MILTRHELEKFTSRKRSTKDRRVYVAQAVFSYFNENGEEFRKSFESKPETHENEFWQIAPKTITQ